MDKRERKMLRRRIGSYSWALLIYYMLLNFLVSMTAEIALIYEGLQAVIRGGSWLEFAAGMERAMEEVLYGNAWGYLIACGIAVAAIRLWKGKAFFKGMFESKQAMSGRSFLGLACIIISGQLVFQVFAVVAELVLNLFGLSLLQSLEMASAGADTLSMFLYMGLAAPVVEELLFRGLILRGLQPYGKRFAIVASSVLFGLFHGNLVQSPYAFVVGLVLGYTAVEYSITWAMVLHMLNNLILGDSLLRVFSGLPGMGAELAVWVVILICSGTALTLLWKNRRMFSVRRSQDPIEGKYMKAFVTAFPTILLFLLMSGNAVMMLFL